MHQIESLLPPRVAARLVRCRSKRIEPGGRCLPSNPAADWRKAGEVLGLRWEDINTKWHGLTIRDKVEGERVIPLTPYVSHLVHSLPRRNECVFSSASKYPAAQTLSIPRNPHQTACKVAGIDGLTLHGLRRSFKSLTEWLEIPAGVVAQLMGHKPSATVESTTPCARLTCCACITKRLKPGFWNRPG